MTGAPLRAGAEGVARRRTGFMIGVVLLGVLDVMLSPIFILIAPSWGNFSMTVLSINMAMLACVLMCFISPVAAVVAGLARVPRRFVLLLALLPVLALAGAVGLLKGMGML